MTCRLEIFRTELTPDKNAKIESIDTFLDTLEYSTKVYDNPNFQYQRITLDKEIKVSIEQEQFNGYSVGNYIRITQDDNKYYYFILSNEWLSTSACRLFCSIDSINTFVDELEWSDKTNVMREHRDRFRVIPGTANSDQMYFMARPVPGGATRTFTFQDDTLIAAEIQNFSYNVTSVEGNGYVEGVHSTSFDPKTGTMTFEASIKVIGDSRAKYTGYITFAVNYVNAIRRVIDPTPEGLSPQLYGEDKGEILNQNDKSNWYVVYNTNVKAENAQGVSSPVDTLLCKDESITAMVNAGYSNSVVITPQDIETGHYYFLDPFNGTGSKYKDNLVSFHYWKGTKSSQNVYNNLNELVLKTATSEQVRGDRSASTDITCLVFYKSGSGIQCDKVYFNGYTDIATAPEGDTTVTPLGLTEKITIRSDQAFKVFDSTTKPASRNDTKLYDIYKNAPVRPNEGGSKEPVRIGAFAEVDVTQSTLIKIIKLPYCPINYTIDNQGRYNFEYNLIKNAKENNKLNTDLLQVPTTVKFKSTIKSDLENPLYKAVENVDIKPDTTERKNPKYESKLYNSEFYQPKFVYDSFGFSFDLEKVDTDTTIPSTTEIEFVPTRVFNSNMMFRFNDYKTKDKDLEDFNNILIANRNNEMPIFSSDYLNYIRNGYNYDKKVKDRNFAWGMGTAAANTAVQVGMAIAGAGIPSKVFHRYMKKDAPYQYNVGSGAKEWLDGNGNNLTSSLVTSGAIQNTVSGIFSMANVLKQKKDTEMAIEQKKNVLANQATSVGNADSVDLLQEYCNNKAKAKLYTPNELTKEMLFDLFYYTGYNTDVKKLPNTTSRYWFNYIQCEPVFVGRNAIVYNNFIDDIKIRYNQGVTVYHNHNGVYDIRQQKENWETNLVK